MVASDCRHFQKQAGSAISHSVGVTASSLLVYGLKTTDYEYIRNIGPVILPSYCPTSGTTLISQHSDDPYLIFIKTASLEDPSVVEHSNPKSLPEDSYSRPIGANRASSFIGDLLARQMRLKVS